ncbi:hypothetical protein O181_031686 [Austropuccinia psidii MF-1]|uniref:Uncharacterized protein n=1 Tax=Austropuccinia psidii MF-1 TaxID=1389203 RepID=A0A9Q3CVC4_9BASI|nr:hypothetical protein [Austropuccinia psidii MF-1]
MLVQVPKASHTNAYTQRVACNSLSLARLPTLSMQWLMLVQLYDTSRKSPYAQCLTSVSHAKPYSQRFTCNSLLLVQVPNASHTNPYA